MKAVQLRRLVLGSLVIAGCSAADADISDPVEPQAANPETSAEDTTALAPREPLASAPLPTAPEPGLSYRLVVKFKDSAQARVTADRDLKFASAKLDPAAARAVAKSHRLAFRPALDVPAETLRSMKVRAAAESGIAQPDLEGIMALDSESTDYQELVTTARELEKLESVEYVHLEPLDVRPPTDIAPTTANFRPEQVYFGADQGINADYAHSVNAKGQGIKISDVEYNWRATHEDLNEINLNLEPGQTIAAPFPDDDHHGAAVMGVLVGMHNAYGVSGIVPLATPKTFPEKTVQRGHARSTAIANAIAGSAAGDVVLLEMQTVGANGQYVPAEYDPTIHTLVKNATQAGVIVVACAGNGGANLDSAPYATYRSWGDSGAIIVGAGNSSLGRAIGSGWSSTYGSRVNLHGWGGAVTTLGYGDRAAYNNDRNQMYTSNFAGTSAAGAMIAAAVVSTQSYAVQKIGRRLTPAEMRALLISTGRAQTGAIENVGPLPDLLAAFTVLNRFPVGAGTANRVQDPGFENQPSAAVAPPWSGVGDYRWIEQNIGKQRSGLDAAIIYSEAAAPGFKAYTQTVSMTANTDYRFTTFVRGTNGINGNLTLKHPGGTYMIAQTPFIPASSTSYSQVAEAVFNSGNITSAPLEFGYNAPASTQWVNVDDFELVAVNPLPSNGNILVDPSFDRQPGTTFSHPWQLIGGGGAVERSVGKSRRGPNTATIWSGDTGQLKAVRQRIAVRPNTSYTFRGYTQGLTTLNMTATVAGATGTLGSTTAKVKYLYRFEPFAVTFNSGTNTWVDVTVGFTSPGGSTHMHIDDLSLIAN